VLLLVLLTFGVLVWLPSFVFLFTGEWAGFAMFAIFTAVEGGLAAWWWYTRPPTL
jgi:hypothetical protein